MRKYVVTAALAGIAGTAVVGVATVVVLRSGQALPGTTVAGVDVGGLDRAELRAAVSEPVRARTDGVLPVIVAGDEVGLERAALTVEVDIEATVDRALDAGRTGYLLAGVLGPLLPLGDRSVEIEVEVDQAALEQRLLDLAAGLDAEPTPGDVVIDGTQVSAVAPEPGRVLDRAQAGELVEQALLVADRGPVELPVDTVPALTTTADVERVAAQARAALAIERYRLDGAGATVEVTAAQVGPLLAARLVEGDLLLHLDRAGLYGLVHPQAVRIDRAPRSAVIDVPTETARFDDQHDTTWQPRAAAIAIQPSAPGRDVPKEAATNALAELVLAAQPTGELPVETTAPGFSSADAEAAGITSLVSTFTTYYTAGQPRARNIARMADLVNGTYVPAGGSFSLNDRAGRRTIARGFEADGAIIDGELVDVVGGGVSQFATTTYNAAFFAGVPILEHRPHSFYISRYPVGRESTLNFGTIDVRFRNDTGNGLLIAASTTASSVTVSFYGDNGGRRVSAQHGPRTAEPDGGFAIRVVRDVTGGDGQGGRRVFTTSYNPPPE